MKLRARIYPVSYTHLDVYKRQGKCGTATDLCGSCEKRAEGTGTAGTDPCRTGRQSEFSAESAFRWAQTESSDCQSSLSRQQLKVLENKPNLFQSQIRHFIFRTFADILPVQKKLAGSRLIQTSYNIHPVSYTHMEG